MTTTIEHRIPGEVRGTDWNGVTKHLCMVHKWIEPIFVSMKGRTVPVCEECFIAGCVDNDLKEDADATSTEQLDEAGGCSEFADA